MSEERTDKKYSQTTSSKLNKFQMSPSLDPVVQKDQKQNGERRKDAASKTQPDNKPASSSFMESPKQKSREETQNSCKGHQAKDLPVKRSLFTDAKGLSVSDKNKSSPSAKDCTSGSSSSLWKEVPLTGEGDIPVPPKPAQPSSTQNQQLAQKFVPFKFRIPKKSQPRTAPSSDANGNHISSNKTPEKKYENKLPESEVLKRKPELETVHPCGSLGDSCNSSSSSVQLPPSGVTNIKPCYDQVMT